VDNINYFPDEYYFTTMYNRIYNGKYLSKISANRSDLEINFISIPYDNNNYSRVLNEIKVMRRISSGVRPFQNYELTYVSSDGFTDSDRFFLQGIIFKDQALIKQKEYGFEYNDIDGLPKRLSNSKDYLGYFNGSTNGTALP